MKALLKFAALALSLGFTVSAAAGNDSGGGGFKDENSKYLFEHAKNSLLTQIRNASYETFKSDEIGTGFFKDKQVDARGIFIEALQNVVIRANQPASRYGRELIFNYQTSPKKRIIVQKGFVDAYASVPVTSLLEDGEYATLNRYINEIEIRLLHEAAHLISIGTSQQTDIRARAFALALKRSFDDDYVDCQDVTPARFARIDRNPYSADLRTSLYPKMKFLRVYRTHLVTVSNESSPNRDGQSLTYVFANHIRGTKSFKVSDDGKTQLRTMDKKLTTGLVDTDFFQATKVIKLCLLLRF